MVRLIFNVALNSAFTSYCHHKRLSTILQIIQSRLKNALILIVKFKSAFFNLDCIICNIVDSLL